MTSATMKPASTTERQVEGRGHGMVAFAAVVVAIVGCFNLIFGIAAVANSHVFVAGAHYVWGDLRFWGWVTLAAGVLQLIASAGIMTGNQLARWYGVFVVSLSAIAMMFFLPAFPLWALVIIAVNIVAVYGLCAYGGRANVTGA
ncbi:MAG: hypothetical protein J2P35_01295 [Actinobacteria bacterium]|nr:hypothetical protein [Actinomycetota bacterium]MBO0784800.1 hypothetical protein [Actinomycetota bacterium]